MAFCLIGVYCKVLNFIPYWLVLVEFFVLATQLVQVIPCSVFPQTLALRFLIAVSAKIFVCHEMSFKTTTMSPAISCLSHCTTSCSAPLSTSVSMFYLSPCLSQCFIFLQQGCHIQEILFSIFLLI